jgi:hypothetical protein
VTGVTGVLEKNPKIPPTPLPPIFSFSLLYPVTLSPERERYRENKGIGRHGAVTPPTQEPVISLSLETEGVIKLAASSPDEGRRRN